MTKVAEASIIHFPQVISVYVHIHSKVALISKTKCGIYGLNPGFLTVSKRVLDGCYLIEVLVIE